MNVLVSFDGPKGVGKTTLIKAVVNRLVESGHLPVPLIEKELLPAAQAAMLGELYSSMKQRPCAETDQAIADVLKSARQSITRDVLPAHCGRIVLLDRWYPSDAVFRKFLSPAVAVHSNIAAGVRVPDLIFAVTCDPEISWRRAAERERSLDSKVIRGFDDHALTTSNFERAAVQFGWHVLRTDERSAEELAAIACREIEQRIRTCVAIQ